MSIHTPESSPAPARGGKRDEAWLSRAVEEVAEDVRRSRDEEVAHRRRKARPKRSRVIPIALAVGAVAIGAELWYLSQPLTPEADGPAPRVDADQAAAATAIGDALIVQAAMEEATATTGEVPDSLNSVAATLPDEMRLRAEYGGLTIEVVDGAIKIASDEPGAPTLILDPAASTLQPEGTR